MQRLGAMWSDLALDKKEFFNVMAKQEKQEYQQKLAAAGHPAPGQKKKVTSKKSKSGYMLFCDDKRELIAARLKTQFGDKFKYTQVMVALGASWKQVSEAEKEIYNAKAKKIRDDARVAESIGIV